jgi:DNA-binding MarR family transcriptional regulator
MLPEAEFVRKSVHALNHYFERRIQERVLEIGFTLPQMRVMQAVVDHGGIGIKRLAQDLQMTQSTVSDIVERLSDKGIVEKRVSARDRRAVEIWPVADVEAFMARDRSEFVNRPVADPMQGLAPPERETVLEGLRLLLARLAEAQAVRA